MRMCLPTKSAFVELGKKIEASGATLNYQLTTTRARACPKVVEFSHNSNLSLNTDVIICWILRAAVACVGGT